MLITIEHNFDRQLDNELGYYKYDYKNRDFKISRNRYSNKDYLYKLCRYEFKGPDNSNKRI